MNKELSGKIGLEPKEAQEYIINKLGLKDTNTTRNKISKILIPKYKPIKIHPKLDLIGFKQEDVDSAADDLSKQLIDKAHKVIEKTYSGKKLDIKDFETSKYKFNTMYDNNGNPTQYMKMIKYIEENGFGEPIDLIIASKHNENVKSFDELELEIPSDKLKAIQRFSGGIIHLLKVGILKYSMGEIIEGINFDTYMQFIDKKIKELEASGVEIKES